MARWRALVGVSCALAALIAIGSGPARALTDEDIFRNLRWNLTSPGARTLAVGGAFTGIADEVTAIEANPAGLWSLGAPELFAEFRVIDGDRTVFASSMGSLEVTPVTGERDLPFLELSSVSEPETASDAAFIGVAWPFSLGSKERRLTIAGSRSLVLSDERSLGPEEAGTGARFAFDSFPNTVNGDQVEAYSVTTMVTGDIDMSIVSWNFGAAYELTPDFAIGATATYMTLDVEASTTTQIVDPLELFVDPSHPRLPPNPAVDVYGTRIDDSDAKLTYVLGVHWHPATSFATGLSPWSFGAVFRKGAEFRVQETTMLNETEDEIFDNVIVVPDRYAVGVSYRMPRQWLFAFELERIQFSDIFEEFKAGVNYLTSGRLADGAFGTDPNVPIRYSLDDATVPRVGAEFRPGLGGSVEIAVQAGWYRMADSRPEMTSFNSTDPEVNAAYLEAFRGGDPVDHATVGVTVRYGSSRFQAAGDFSNVENRFAASYVFAWAGRGVQVRGGKP